MPSYWRIPRVATVSFNAKAHTINAVQPATPPIVINNLLLKRARFLIDTLFRKLRRFQIKGRCSRSTRAPAFGDFGRNNAAGTCLVSLQLTIIVHIATGITNASTQSEP